MEAKSKAKVILPDGEYKGLCTGYYAKVHFNDIWYKFQIDSGRRFEEMVCTVTVVNSFAYIKT